MSLWHFSSAIGDERKEALLQTTTFTAIVETIAQDMKVLCCHRQDCDDLARFSRVVLCCHRQDCDDLARFSRVIFNLCLPKPTFDLFFNSEHGYRGAYFDSPHIGLAANEACIRRLTPLLLNWAAEHEPSLDQAFAQESLASPTAKVWLTESESHLCGRCVGEWGNPTNETTELSNGRWELANTPSGRRGRKAPFLSKLRVFGAFLNERYDEFTPARKRHRAKELNEGGWS